RRHGQSLQGPQTPPRAGRAVRAPDDGDGPLRRRPMTERRPTLKNLEALIEGRGDITVGRVGPTPCIATAADEDFTYAMLQRRPSESLLQLLERLDATLAWAWEHEETVDEINPPHAAP